jgi:hypothetical protein
VTHLILQHPVQVRIDLQARPLRSILLHKKIQIKIRAASKFERELKQTHNMPEIIATDIRLRIRLRCTAWRYYGCNDIVDDNLMGVKIAIRDYNDKGSGRNLWKQNDFAESIGKGLVSSI